MGDHDTRLEVDIRDLKAFGLRLDSLIKPWFEMKIQYDADNVLDTMYLTFISKQREHLRSMYALGDANCNRDCILIARTSVEGLAILLWALKDSETRTKRWNNFAYVVEFREMIRAEQRGVSISQEQWDALYDGLERYGGPFLRKKCKGIPVRRRSDDCYSYEWLDISISSLFEVSGGSELYQTIYQSASIWGHWSSHSIFSTLLESGEFINYSKGHRAWVALSYAAGFQAFFQTTELVADYFSDQIDPSIRRDLQSLRSDFDKRLADANESIEAMSNQE